MSGGATGSRSGGSRRSTRRHHELRNRSTRVAGPSRPTRRGRGRPAIPRSARTDGPSRSALSSAPVAASSSSASLRSMASSSLPISTSEPRERSSDVGNGIGDREAYARREPAGSRHVSSAIRSSDSVFSTDSTLSSTSVIDVDGSKADVNADRAVGIEVVRVVDGVDHAGVDRVDPAQGHGGGGEQQRRVVVALVDRHPGHLAAAASTPTPPATWSCRTPAARRRRRRARNRAPACDRRGVCER